MHKLRPIVTACSIALVALAAQSQTTDGQSTGKTAALAAGANKVSLSEADHNFVRDAAQSGTAEVQASQLAASRAVRPEVKQFAQQMVADHTKANAQLQQLAQAKGIVLPDPTPAQKSVLKSLEAKTGAEFDRQYMDEFGVKAHHQAVDLFRSEAQKGQDTDLKGFAQKTLPTLEQHLKHATDTKASLK